MTIDLYCQRRIDYVDILLGVPPLGVYKSTITILWVKMAIFNLYTRKYPAIRKPYVMRPRLLLTINCKFAVDFFARGLHTRTAVARLPLRQLGFLVLQAIVGKTTP